MGKKNKKKKVQPQESVNTNNDIVALIEKRAGNDAYFNNNYTQAIEHYTTGIALSAKNPQLLVAHLVNRAVSFIRIKV